MSLAKAAAEINAVMNRMRVTAAGGVRGVVICYDHDDRAIVEDLARRLEANGYPAWWDHHLEAGAEFRERIGRAIDEAFAVIGLWSDRSRHSLWLIWEATQAAKRDKLIPLVAPGVDPSDLPPPFNGLTSLALGDEARLIAELERLRALR